MGRGPRPRVNGPSPAGRSLQSKLLRRSARPAPLRAQKRGGSFPGPGGVYLRLRFDAPTIRTLPPLGLNVLTWPSAQRTS
jgi:hypothetical protein